MGDMDWNRVQIMNLIKLGMCHWSRDTRAVIARRNDEAIRLIGQFASSLKSAPRNDGLSFVD